MDADKLKASLSGGTYNDLVQFLNLHLSHLKNIDNIQVYSAAADQAIEVKAQKKAYQKLSAILSEVITIHDIAELPKDTGNDYGLDEK